MTVQEKIEQAQRLADGIGEALGTKEAEDLAIPTALASIAYSLVAMAAMQYAQRTEDELERERQERSKRLRDKVDY